MAVAERTVEVVAIDSDAVALRGLGTCSQCVGCGGRCNLFQQWSDDGTLRLPAAGFPRAPQIGEHWRVALADDDLLQQSLRGYGSALASLLLGASGGYGGALALGLSTDAPTAVGALLGTLLAVRISKRGRLAGLRLIEPLPER